MSDVTPFVEDLESPLYGITLRSPIAKGRLLGIQCPDLPPNYLLIQHRDIPGKALLEDFALPILAGGNLSYIGEPVGLLIGPDSVQLEEIAARCSVQAEEEQPQFNLHESPETGIFAKRTFGIGEIGSAFSQAETIVEGIYSTGIQEHLYSEPVGALAMWDRGAIILRTATQWPFHVKRSVAALLDMQAEQVQVETTQIGLPLEGKLWYPSLVACHAALGAFVTKNTVKIMLSRLEDFRYSPKRNGTEIRIRTALSAGGEHLGTEIQCRANLGAHGVYGDEFLDRLCLGALGIYNQRPLRIEGIGVETNLPPGGPISGFGMAQGFFSMERQASILANTLRIKPLEWRKEHMLNRREFLLPGLSLKNRIPMEELLNTLSAMGDYDRKWASYEMLRMARRREDTVKTENLRGIGIAVAYQSSGFLYYGADEGAYSVELTLEKNGKLRIKTSAVSSHRTIIEVWQGIAAEILSIDPSVVWTVSDAADQAYDSGPSGFSRNITEITSLIEQACIDIRDQRFRDPLPITVVRTSHPQRKEIWNNRFIDPQSMENLSWGAALVEVSIDPIECIPTIRGIWLTIDGGRIISEELARRTLRQNVIQALGWASREKIEYEDGRLPDWQFYNYQIPKLRDIPPIYIDFIMTDRAESRGIGELPFNCIPAAYVEAVSQAIDFPFMQIPLTSDDIINVKNLLNGEGSPWQEAPVEEPSWEEPSWEETLYEGVSGN